MATNNSINSVLDLTNFTVDPGASGDSYVQFDINGTGEFRIGVDDDAGDSFKVSQGSDLGSTDTFIMTAAGERTMPLQPAFLGYLGTTDSNATGDGTTFTVGSGNALTEVFDQGSDFTTAGIFTAPITGRYKFTYLILLDDLATANTLTFPLIQTSNHIFSYYFNGGAVQSSGDLSINMVAFTDMDAADTTFFTILVTGGTKIIDVIGGANGNTSVSGYLVC